MKQKMKPLNRVAGNAVTLSNKLPTVKLEHLMELSEDDFSNLQFQNYCFFGITITPCSTTWKINAQNNPQILADFAISMGQKNNFTISELHYEYKEEQKIGKYPHVHFTAIRKTTNFRFYSYGLHIKIKPIYNYPGWRSYCKKDELKSDYSFINTEEPSGSE